MARYAETLAPPDPQALLCHVRGLHRAEGRGVRCRGATVNRSLVTDACPGWTDAVAALLPGAHVAVLANEEADRVGIEGRMIGLEVRDTLAVLRAGPRTSYVLLFRKPLVKETVAEQVLATGTGAINIDACRVGLVGEVEDDLSGRWPTNLVLVHGPRCQNVGTKKVTASNAPGRASQGIGERGLASERNQPARSR